MSSTSLWFTIVWIAIVAFITDSVRAKELVSNFGVKEEHYKWFPAIAMILPSLYFAVTRRNFIDTEAYRSDFLSINPSFHFIKETIMGDGKDKGFTIFNTIVKYVIGNRDIVYFAFIAIICIFALVYVYRKYSCSYAITMFLFFASTDYLEWICNGIRQFIPVTILFFCIDFILKKQYGKMILIILIMSTIHGSALIMLPAIFIVQGKAWNRMTLFFIFIMLIVIYYINDFTPLLEDLLASTQYNDVVQQFAEDDGVNILRVLFYGMPTIISLVFKRRLDRVATPLSNLCINMSILSTCFYVLGMFTSGIYVGRIPIYFSLYNYILLPWEIDNLFTESSKKVVYIFMIIFYLVFYYYQVFISWGL